MTLNSICVCGAGTMGSGIAQALSLAGYHTILFDVNRDMLDKARQQIFQSLEQMQAKGRIEKGAAELALQQINFTGELHDCLADFFIEAIIEKKEAKIALFNQLAEINHSEAVFATNTSSLSVTEIASKIHLPARVLGVHFFNPPVVMKLVEVVRTVYNDEQTVTTAVTLVNSLKKTAVICQDAPGFIVNRVARPYYIEAMRLVEEFEISIGEVDALMEASGFRLGPFRLMDLIGNDINYAVSNSVYEQLNKPERLRPSEIQRQIVEAGKLGKKTGEGFYKYD